MTTIGKTRILLAEDDDMVAEIIKRMLMKLNYDCVGIAPNGAQAVEMVQSLTPDAVVMDVAMPKMNGLEAAREIQNLCPTPVIILTAYQSKDILQEATEAGAGAYLTKPPELNDLDRAITIAMARHEDLLRLQEMQKKIRARTDELAEVNRKLEEQLRIDPLTGIFSRRHGLDLLNQELARRGRYGTACSVLLLDIDDFKHINDEYGHASGDEALRAVGHLFERVLRSTDSAVRYGGG